MGAKNGQQAKEASPILGITMGDPAGIGPEVIAKALAMREVRHLCRPIVIGSLPVMEEAIRALRAPLKAIQRGRSEREAEAYPCGTLRL
jgi:4-hydroxythreonine-4-phosphate dehydrogenase